ncbi:EamA family transporter [Williamsia maris]|uniref:Threonine/homoserine efflux transporter RhtA n=1 Tax=Williamsia maris TaxID=72806 RepID=A0ABT1HJ30_9NOCA|nr:DMT family transporter [Williamsia maris]MCP2177947.1 Threonine/homoserine efflux transporter RhtA [Williamsia maris]
MNRTASGGLMVAAVSATAFGMSGPLAKSLIDAGWSSTAASALRLGLGAALLVVPVLILRPRRLLAIGRAPIRVVAYGVLAVAVVQLSFFNAVRYLDVPIALLIEYSAPVMVIGFEWAVRGRRPGRVTLAGGAVAVAGLLVVIGGGAGVSIDPVGVAWALAAAVGLAAYFILAEESEDAAGSVDPIALTCGGLVVGAVLVGAAGAVGWFPMRATTADVTLAGHATPWWVAALAVAGVATTLAYVTGITAVRMLGPTPASFVALLEVVASAVASAVLLGQVLRPLQVLGAFVLLAGIVAVRTGSSADARAVAARRSGARPPEPISPTGNPLSPTEI